MLTIVKRLQQHPFLRQVSAENILTLAEATHPVVFQPGEWIVRQGRKARSLYLIEKGVVELGLLTKGPGTPLVISHIHKGGSLGWSWAFPPFKWKFDARAKTRVEALALDGRPVMDKCGLYPLLGYEVMKKLAESLAKRLEGTRHQLVHMARKHPDLPPAILYYPSPIV
ncbi:MAG TPA: cyclic nucleotide-binding domain-containing protein [bacterium]|nr:cyclic nucleotide-binding domain-containing protein [bacterium]